MKKALFIALIATFGVIGLVSAETPSKAIANTSSESDFHESTNPLGAINARNNIIQLYNAIAKRRSLYFSQKFRSQYRAETGENYDSITNQRLRLPYYKSQISVNDRSTDISRTGELKGTEGRRPVTKYRAQRSNAKQTLRARAICYYVEGGDANEECLKSNVIDGQRHRAIPTNFRFLQGKVGREVITPVRELQKISRPEINNNTVSRVSNFRKSSYKSSWYNSDILRLPEPR